MFACGVSIGVVYLRRTGCMFGDLCLILGYLYYTLSYGSHVGIYVNMAAMPGVGQIDRLCQIFCRNHRTYFINYKHEF